MALLLDVQLKIVNNISKIIITFSVSTSIKLSLSSPEFCYAAPLIAFT